MNIIDNSGKNKFTMSVANGSRVYFQELKFKCENKRLKQNLGWFFVLPMCFFLHVILKGT